MESIRKGCMALALKCLPILLMVTLISANLLTTTSGLEISHTSVSSLTNCDGVGTFFCPTGTCYTGHDGFVGCCSVSSCAARTTCIPYTSGVSQTCDMNTGGCVTCTTDLPACVTITNVVNSQYVMYCGQDSLHETISYTNLVTTGSMAFPPSQAPSSSSRMASSTPFSTTTTVATAAVAATDDATDGNMPAVPTTETAVIIGSFFGLLLLFVTIYYVMRAWQKREREREMTQQAASHNRPGPFEIPGNSRLSTNTASAMTPRRLQKPPILRGKSMISTTDAMNLDDYLSPIARDRLARQAEARDAARAEELDGSELAPYLDAEGQIKDSWTPPAIRSNGEANPSARWSLSNAPTPFKAYQPTNSLDSRISELPSIRRVQPSGSHRSSFKSSESICVSPNPSNYVDTPLVGGVSPLMDKWHNGDRASVGETSATVNGPTNWFSPMHVQSRPASGSHAVSCSSTLTSATGGGAPYVSPETAMAEGYSAGHGESA